MTRTLEPSTDVLRFGPFTLSLASRELRRDGTVLEVAPKVHDLLSLLIRERHRVVTHDEVISSVWDRTHLSKGVLPQTVHKLRQVLDLPGQSSSWIKGVRRVGYRFVGHVEGNEHSEETASDVQATPVGWTDEVCQRLFELGREQIRVGDLEGLGKTVLTLRSSDSGGGSRHCLIAADLFESLLARVKGDGKAAWQSLCSAQVLLDGLGAPFLSCELHSYRGMYFECFTNEDEAVVEFELAWSIAERLGDVRLQADCASRLAFVLSTASDSASLERWTERSLQLAARCGSRSVYVRHSVWAAIAWQRMAARSSRSGERASAVRSWTKALRLHDAALAEDDSDQVGARTHYVASVNSMYIRGLLYPDQRQRALQGLKGHLKREKRPASQAQLHELIARLLLLDAEEGKLARASFHCKQAVALRDEHGLIDQLEGLLEVAAEVASARGKHQEATRWLRRLLSWRTDQSERKATQTAVVTTARLDAERSVARVAAERENARLLRLENEVLRQRTELMEKMTDSVRYNDIVSAAHFERVLATVWAAASAQQLPHCLAMMQLHDAMGTSVAVEPERVRSLIRQLLETCNGSDLIARLSKPATFAVLFNSVELPQALLLCELMLFRLKRSVPSLSLSIGLVDSRRVPDPATALVRVEEALEQSIEAGGDRAVVDTLPP